MNLLSGEEDLGAEEVQWEVGWSGRASGEYFCRGVQGSQAVVDRTDIAAEVEVLIKRRDRRLLSQLITFPERQLRLRPVEELFQDLEERFLRQSILTKKFYRVS